MHSKFLILAPSYLGKSTAHRLSLSQDVEECPKYKAYKKNPRAKLLRRLFISQYIRDSIFTFVTAHPTVLENVTGTAPVVYTEHGPTIHGRIVYAIRPREEARRRAYEMSSHELANGFPYAESRLKGHLRDCVMVDDFRRYHSCRVIDANTVVEAIDWIIANHETNQYFINDIRNFDQSTNLT